MRKESELITMRLMFRDIACGTILLAGLLTLGCSSSHFQVFSTTDEAQFTAWAAATKGPTEVSSVNRVGEWMKHNMQYAQGLILLWADYLYAWGSTTNCTGYAAVALEGLHRMGYRDYVYLYVDYPGGWHVICVRDNRTLWASNTGWGPCPPSTGWADLARWVNPRSTYWAVYSRSRVKIDSGALPAPSPRR